MKAFQFRSGAGPEHANDICCACNIFHGLVMHYDQNTQSPCRCC